MKRAKRSQPEISGIIYKIRNLVNGKIYIGQTKKDLSRRIAYHVNKSNHQIGNALKKYGLQSFKITVIDFAEDASTLSEKERFWISTFDCQYPNGYNHTAGGDGLVNPSKRVRNQISRSLKSYYRDHEPTAGFTGHKHKRSSKRKISKALIEAMSNPKVREKMSAAGKGKPKSELHKKHISEGSIGANKGRVPWNKGLKNAQVAWNKNHNDPRYKNYIKKVVASNKARKGCSK